MSKFFTNNNIIINNFVNYIYYIKTLKKNQIELVLFFFIILKLILLI